MRKLALIALPLLAGLAAATFVLVDRATPASHARVVEHLSPVYTIDRAYRSMMGPSSTQEVSFPEKETRELVWVTGYNARMVGADGTTPMSQEYMCHSNLDFDADRHSKLLRVPAYHTDRLFTLSQGQFDIEFPPGFGLPFYSDEVFKLTTQVLDLNFDSGPQQVRHRVKIDYVLDRDLDEPMTPLFMTSGWGLVLLKGDDGYYGISEPDETEHGASCLPGEAASQDHRTDSFGREFSGHWVVQPGREVNRTLVTQIMNLPYDTTLHYIAVHLHPFAESLELIDLTTGESIFHSKADNKKDRIGLDRVDYFESIEGIPVYKDHEYEMVSVYDNTSDQPQDSMAVMLLYLADKKFKKGDGVRPEVRRVEGTPAGSGSQIVLHTNLGDITIGLLPDVAPEHVAQIVRLVENGIYEGVPFFRVEPGFLMQTGYVTDRSGAPLTPDQMRMIRPIRAELSDIQHRLGTVSMVPDDNADPHSATTSLMILLGDAPALDEAYTVFGRVEEGLDTLTRIAAAPRTGNSPNPRIEIESAEVRE